MTPHRLRERTPQLGTWMSLGSSIVAELAADSGFDWLLFDLEHGCGTEANLLPQLQALRGSTTAGVVRVGAPHPELIGRVLDWGADAIMVPHVSSAAEAETCVQALRYPPRGRRGVSRSVRAYRYGLTPFTPDQPVFFAQIETLQAVECIQDIAKTDGVDVLFVGTADLLFDLEQRTAEPTKVYEQCLAQVFSAAAKFQKGAGILVRDAASVPKFLAQGFTHVAVESDISILRQAYAHILSSRKPIG